MSPNTDQPWLFWPYLSPPPIKGHRNLKVLPDFQLAALRAFLTLSFATAECRQFVSIHAYMWIVCKSMSFFGSTRTFFVHPGQHTNTNLLPTRPPVPRQKSISPLQTYKLSQDHYQPIKPYESWWHTIHRPPAMTMTNIHTKTKTQEVPKRMCKCRL